MTKIIIRNVKVSPEFNATAARIEGTDANGKKVVTTNNHLTTNPIFNLPDGYFGSIEIKGADGLFHKKKVFASKLQDGTSYELNIIDENDSF